MNGCLCKPCCKCIKCKCGAYAGLFEVLGHPTRLRIITVLQEGPKNVSQIIEETGMEQTCISHCVRKLEKDGYLIAKREGKFRIYELNKEAVAPITDFIKKHLSETA